MNANVYLCSRMLFSLARGGYAPPALGQLRADGAPHRAVVASGACIIVATMLAKVTPRAYAYLQGVALFGAITVWVIILASHLSFRRMHRSADLPVKTPLFPAIQLVGLALLVAILLTMGLDADWNTSLLVGLPWLGLLSIAYVFWRRRRRSDVNMSPSWSRIRP
jgi:LPXTG-motif cell wall-anchored protein